MTELAVWVGVGGGVFTVGFAVWALWVGLGAVGLMVASDRSDRNACPYPWGCLWMLEPTWRWLTEVPWPLSFLIIVKLHEWLALGLVIDAISLPIQLHLRKRWLYARHRQEVKRRMLKAIKKSNGKSNGQRDWEPLQLVEWW